ncbi:hypothetical protein DRN85_10680 [Methanosarcinales archaeon]|nr:MAG: hypothetical protein DRN85_10680 [Methanosarcinales archaeon]
MDLKRVVTTFAISIALLMVAGTGVVSAAQITISPHNLNLVPGVWVPTTVHVTETANGEFDGTQHTLEVFERPSVSGELEYRLTDTNTGGTASGTTISYHYNPTGDPDTIDTYEILVEIKAADGTEGNTYIIRYADTIQGSWDEAVATVHTTAIPEFATIALPLAATIGLFFFFNRRRRA